MDSKGSCFPMHFDCILRSSFIYFLMCILFVNQLLVNSGMLPRLHEVLNGDDFLRPFWPKSCDVISVFLQRGRQRLQVEILSLSSF